MSLKYLKLQISNFYESYIDDVVITKDFLIPIIKQNLINNFKEFKDSEKFIEKCSYIFKFKSKNFSIFLINYTDDDILNLRIKNLCKRIEFLYFLLNITKTFNIWFIPLSNKRLFPNESIQITVNNINGGFTYSSGNDIYIHREEEFPKVILHEFLHHSFFDTSNVWTTSDIDTLKNLFNISDKSNFIPNEAIIELWAEIFHLLFISNELDISFNNLYNDELKWGIYQTINLLKHKETLNLNEWNEKTNAYSYIIIKTILLNNLKQFIDLPIPYNTHALTSFIIKSYEIFKNNFNTQILHNTQKNKSLRMTIYGDL